MSNPQQMHSPSVVDIALFFFQESVGRRGAVEEVIRLDAGISSGGAGAIADLLRGAPKPLECLVDERDGRISVRCRPVPEDVRAALVDGSEGSFSGEIRRVSEDGRQGKLLIHGRNDSMIVEAGEFIRFDEDYVVLAPAFSVDFRKAGEWERKFGIVGVIELVHLASEEGAASASQAAREAIGSLFEQVLEDSRRLAEDLNSGEGARLHGA